jgi:chaperonin GroES
VHGSGVGGCGHRINIDDGQRGSNNDPTSQRGMVDAHGDVSSEAVTGDNKRTVAGLDGFNRGAEVISFCSAARMFTIGAARAAKVEAKHPVTGLYESATEGGNHGIVASSAIERMRVADHGRSGCVLRREKVALQAGAIGALKVHNLDVNRFHVATLPVAWRTVSKTETLSADDGLPVKMLNDRILVSLGEAEGERRSTGGILIPATAQMGKRLTWAEVVAVGPNVRAMEAGDQVLFNPEDRYEVEVRGKDYIILRERDVHALAAERLDEGSTGLYL